MKTNLKLMAGLLTLGLCVCSVNAQDDPGKAKRRKGPPSKERLLERYDTNKDGALDKDELAAMPERLRTRLLERWDEDKSGDLSKDEVDKIKPPERGDRKGKGPRKGDGDKGPRKGEGDGDSGGGDE
jgi:hypothetical protein